MATGTAPEMAVYKALVSLGYADGKDFVFQSSQMGGRTVRGGAILDFYIPSLRVGINVQGFYWHYGNVSNPARDRIQQTQLESQGIRVIYIDEADALSNAKFYVQEALRGVDHSRMSK